MNYLVLIGAVDVLASLYGRVHVPVAVAAELGHDRSPDAVKAWIAAPPDWLVTHGPDRVVELGGLDPGEAAAIALAEDLGADVLLIDERVGRCVAAERGLLPIGTLGVIVQASDYGLIDLPLAVARLLATNFHVRREMIDGILARHGQGPP